MKAKKVLEAIKHNVANLMNPIYNEWEYELELENHSIQEGNAYALYHVGIYRDANCIKHIIVEPFSPFMFPKGLSFLEGLKVLSYLTDFIEKREDIEEASRSSVATLNSVLDLERYGFSRVLDKNSIDVIPLYTVFGRIALFKNTKYYDSYFDWYIPNVTREEVINIYSKINMEFKDIIWLDKTNVKTLKK